MKIGILTLPLHTNYGGILQAYALQTVLERMGHEVVVFDTPNEYPLPPLFKLPFCFGGNLRFALLPKCDILSWGKVGTQAVPFLLTVWAFGTA